MFVVEEKPQKGFGIGVQGRRVHNWYQMPSEVNDLTNTTLIKQILLKGSKWKYKLVKKFAAAATKPFLTS